MGVRATMSLSILCGGRLWGLIACHHYQPRIPPHHVRTALRQVCELVAEVSMLRIEALQQLQAAGDTVALDQTLLLLQQELLQEEDPQVVLHRQLPELLSAFDASALCVRIGKLSYVGGESGADATPEDALDDLAGMLEPSRTAAGVVQRLDLHGPGAAALRTLPVAAGVLVAHQFGESLELCAFTRPEMVTEVHWAGAPTKQLTALPDGRVVLEPRRSFELWSEQVGGTARPWLPAQAEACERLLRILSDNFKRREHKTLEQELRWRAHHDHLTGLYNRRSVEESLEQRMGASRYESAVMLIDLDHFKMINDTHGHGAGDRLLQELSLRLSAVIRPTDILSRVGGDEFLLLAEMSVPEPALALAMAARLHKAMEEPFVIDGQLQRLSISVGIAIPPGHGTNATDLMRRADLALYRAKHSGRASTVIFDAALEAGLSASYELERDLQDAIARNELSLVFQPEVDLGSGRVVGLEALLRWQHPTRGAIEPSVFIPLAERSDLITKLGQWVARTALATQATWRQNTDFNVPVALNVSMMEVLSGKLVEQIGALLREFKLPAGCLGVELTESVIMKDLVLTKNVLRGLRQLGVATALDDFGTGYSSLSYLRQLPLSCLKVDQSFTADLTRDAHSRSLTQAIIRMAEALKMTTIAEGVETRGQLSWLREHECTIGQGYLFSHPVIAPMVQSSIERIEAGWHGLQ
jgi:diguanylate cyclase (GGDEF)-like protein